MPENEVPTVDETPEVTGDAEAVTEDEETTNA